MKSKYCKQNSKGVRVAERTNERTSKVFLSSTIFIEISLRNKKYTLCDTSAFVNVSQNVEKLLFFFFSSFLFSFSSEREDILYTLYTSAAHAFHSNYRFFILFVGKDRTMVRVKCIMYKKRKVECAVCQRGSKMKTPFVFCVSFLLFL